jgi:hypothetical protein
VKNLLRSYSDLREGRGFLAFVLFTKYYQNDQMKEDVQGA